MLKNEEPSVDSIAENVSKMLELVSGHHLRMLFLKILVNEVGYSFAANAPVTVFMTSVICSSIIVVYLDTFLARLLQLFSLE